MHYGAYLPASHGGSGPQAMHYENINCTAMQYNAMRLAYAYCGMMGPPLNAVSH